MRLTKLLNMKIPYLLYMVIVLSGLYFFLVFIYEYSVDRGVDGRDSFYRPNFWIVLLPIWCLLALYAFVRVIFFLRAKGLNYSADIDEVDEVISRDKSDRNA
jgi:hypothetical protein